MQQNNAENEVTIPLSEVALLDIYDLDTTRFKVAMPNRYWLMEITEEILNPKSLEDVESRINTQLVPLKTKHAYKKLKAPGLSPSLKYALAKDGEVSWTYDTITYTVKLLQDKAAWLKRTNNA
ncbi:MAG: hypothetical protein FMNOHCHN_03768 [Ignavibacteriaceae bacterium]|nr:hypothetical protein [Ignavibacteriaceae bacterium]